MPNVVTPRHVSRSGVTVRRQVLLVIVGGFVAATSFGLAVGLAGDNLSGLSVLSGWSGGAEPIPADRTVSPAPQGQRPDARNEAAPAGRWSDVLARLDRRRDRAWSQGSPARLGTVFLPGSAPLREDRASLRLYRDRGYTVGGAELDYWDIRVAGRRRGVVRLRVADRLHPVRVTGPDGHSWRLPSDRPTRHLITLASTAEGWRIGEIRAW